MSRRYREKQLDELMSIDKEARGRGLRIHPLVLAMALRQEAWMQNGIIYLPMNGLETLKARYLPKWLQGWWPVQHYMFALGDIE